MPDEKLERVSLVRQLVEREEYGALVSLACDDPDATVRVLAWMMLLVRSASGRAPWSHAVGAMARVTSPRRRELLEHVKADAPPELRAVVEPSLGDADRGVRLAAFAALVRARIGSDATIRDWLDRAEWTERERAIDRWVELADEETIVRALVGTSHAVRRAAVARFRARGWDDHASLIDRDAELVVVAPPFDGVSLAFLLRLTNPHALLDAARRIDLDEPIEKLRAADLAAFAARCDAWLDAHPGSELHAMVERARDRVR